MGKRWLLKNLKSWIPVKVSNIFNMEHRLLFNKKKKLGWSGQAGVVCRKIQKINDCTSYFFSRMFFPPPNCTYIFNKHQRKIILPCIDIYLFPESVGEKLFLNAWHEKTAWFSNEICSPKLLLPLLQYCHKKPNVSFPFSFFFFF